MTVAVLVCCAVLCIHHDMVMTASPVCRIRLNSMPDVGRQGCWMRPLCTRGLRFLWGSTFGRLLALVCWFDFGSGDARWCEFIHN